MGVKVSKVREKTTKRIITIKDCEDGYVGEYICQTNGCNATMLFNSRHEQRRHEKVIEVPPYFKLKAKEGHAYGVCPFNTEGMVEVIARDSDDNVLKAIGNNKYEFSLQILHRPKLEAIEIDPEENLIGKDVNKVPEQKHYTKNGTASTYIRALKQVLVLRAKLEENTELASLITLDYNGQKIKWDEFYFNVDSYNQAYVMRLFRVLCQKLIDSKIIA